MLYYLSKLATTAILVVIISEIAKRSTYIGALLASIPLTSVLAMLWIYWETKDTGKISGFANGVFWLVLPSLILFVVLPLLLRHNVNFYAALGLAILLTGLGYWVMTAFLSAYGIRL